VPDLFVVFQERDDLGARDRSRGRHASLFVDAALIEVFLPRRDEGVIPA